eukprot:3936469-Rhodomonas_salina.2
MGALLECTLVLFEPEHAPTTVLVPVSRSGNMLEQSEYPGTRYRVPGYLGTAVYNLETSRHLNSEEARTIPKKSRNP